MSRSPAVWMMAIGLATGSCTGSSSADGGFLAETTIESGGGVAATPDGAMIFVPAGAVPAGTSVTLTIALDSSAQTPDGTTAAGSGYVFGPADAQFQVPVTIVLPVVEADLGMVSPPVTVEEVVLFQEAQGAGSSAYTGLTSSPYAGAQLRSSALTTTLGTFFPAIPPQPPVPDAGPPDGGEPDAGDDAGSASSSSSSAVTTSSSSRSTATSSSSSSSATSTTGSSLSTSGSSSGGVTSSASSLSTGSSGNTSSASSLSTGSSGAASNTSSASTSTTSNSSSTSTTSDSSTTGGSSKSSSGGKKSSSSGKSGSKSTSTGGSSTG